MATTDTGGMAHLTVVPENFDPETAERDDDGAATGTESAADER